MLFRLARPVKRSSSSKSQFVRRIPRMCESEQRAGRCRYPSAQRSFTSPSRPEPKPSAFSLRTSDRSETKTRQAGSPHTLKPFGEPCAKTHLADQLRGCGLFQPFRQSLSHPNDPVQGEGSDVVIGAVGSRMPAATRSTGCPARPWKSDASCALS
jgi:hypothetical protein